MSENALTTQAEASQVLGMADDKPSAEWCSIPNDGSRAAAAAIYNAYGDAEKIDDYKDKVIEVSHVAIHTVVVESEEHGAVDAVRCVLISPDGKRYASVANGVKDSLKKMFATFQTPEWVPPLKVTPVEVKTRKGRKTLRLEVRG